MGATYVGCMTTQTSSETPASGETDPSDSSNLLSPPRMKRFYHPEAELLMRAIEQVDVAIQEDILDLLADSLAIRPWAASENARERKAVGSLREAARHLGRSPSVKEYRELRAERPDLQLVADGTLRSWLGNGSWNDCLERAHLDAVSDGDFTSMFLGHRFTDEELETTAREVFADLGHVPTRTAYIRWARRAAVQARGRRPKALYAFDRLGGIGAVMQRVGLVDDPAQVTVTRYAGFSYSKAYCRGTIRKVAERLGHMPSAPEYRRVRAMMIDEARRAGERIALPSYSVLGKKYGNWAAARADAESELPSSEEVDLDDPRRPAGRIYTDEQMFDALRRAFAEIGNPLSIQRYEIWREHVIEEAQARGESERVPSDTILQKRFGGWYVACQLALGDAYVPLQRRRDPRPLVPRAPGASAEEEDQ